MAAFKLKTKEQQAVDAAKETSGVTLYSEQQMRDAFQQGKNEGFHYAVERVFDGALANMTKELHDLHGELTEPFSNGMWEAVLENDLPKIWRARAAKKKLSIR